MYSSYLFDSTLRPSGMTAAFGSGTSTPLAVSFADAYVPLGQPGAGQLASVTDSNSGVVTQYSYTAQGFVRQLSRGGGGAPIYTILGEDASLRPTRTSLGSASFTNSLTAGSPTSVTDSYSYDQLNQAVTGAETKSYGYDTPTGNLTSKSDTGTYAYGRPAEPGRIGCNRSRPAIATTRAATC